MLAGLTAGSCQASHGTCASTSHFCLKGQLSGPCTLQILEANAAYLSQGCRALPLHVRSAKR